MLLVVTRICRSTFKGICVTDGYQVYHTIEKEQDDLQIAGCWVHARRKFNDALEQIPKKEQKPYEYFEYLLSEIPKHMDDHDLAFLEDLLPWSPELPGHIRKKSNDLSGL